MAGSMRQAGTDGKRGGGFLTRLRRDARGMTLAMMAAFLVPITALAGSTIDLARMYVVKSRLQQACDAGVLAGRKFMNDSNTGSTLDGTATQRAADFFNNNFKKGWMGTTAVRFKPSKTKDNQVLGGAQADMPMTIMKMFGFRDSTIAVTCQARFDVADTDILFVLDTTGSMSCLPGDSDTACDTYAVTATKTSYTRPVTTNAVASYAGGTGWGTTEKTGSRISALRTAVLSFYDTFKSNADPSTHVRYGFVTYSSAVNGGGAIMGVAPQMIVGNSVSETAPYQSREITGQYVSSWKYTSENNGKTEKNCTARTRVPATDKTFDGATGTAKLTWDEWDKTKKVCKTREDILGPTWTYRQRSLNVQAFVSSGRTGTGATDPTKARTTLSRWGGCLEEPAAATTAGATTFNVTSLPTDLNPDSLRSGSTRWFPHWQDVTYARNASGAQYALSFSSRNDGTSDGDDTAGAPNYGSASMLQNFASVCAKPVQRLAVLTRDQVRSFVYAPDFVPMGNTYHDTGMIWGVRLLSPTGLFAADTAAWPNRNPPNRVIVFMTDGDMKPAASAYGIHGVEYFDRRVSAGDTANLTNYHNKRFLAECSAAKARNIDIWVVQIDSAASAEMQACATTKSQALFTTSGDGLSAAFATIAEHLAMLRITQ